MRAWDPLEGTRSEASKDMWSSGPAEESIVESEFSSPGRHLREKRLIARYPIEKVGLGEVLSVSWEIRQQRMVASMEGVSVDGTVLTDDEDQQESDLTSRLSALATLAGNNVAERISARNKSQPLALPDTESLRHSLSAGERLFRQYATSVQESDAAASMAKASSNLSAAAIARWSFPSKSKLPPDAAKSEAPRDQVEADTEDQTSSQMSERIPDQADTAEQDRQVIAPNEEIRLDEPIMNKAIANLSRRDTSLPPSFFISPRGSIVYPQGRYRPKAPSGEAKSSLSSRLAAAAATASGIPEAKDRIETKTLKKAGSMARSSSPTSTRSLSTRSITSDGEIMYTNGRFGSSGGSVSSRDRDSYVSRQSSVAQDASGDSPPNKTSARNPLARRSIAESSSAKVKTDVPSRGRRAQSADLDGSHSKARGRYSLVDTGPSRPGSPEQMTPGELTRYQLSDAPAGQEDESHKRSNSLETGSGVKRRNKVQARPAGLKLRTRTSLSKEEIQQGVIDPDRSRHGLAMRDMVESNLPSPLPEEPSTPVRVSNNDSATQDTANHTPGGMKRSSRRLSLKSIGGTNGGGEEVLSSPPRAVPRAEKGRSGGGSDTPEKFNSVYSDGYGDLLENYAALSEI